MADDDARRQKARELGERGRDRCAEGLAAADRVALAEAAELLVEALELLDPDDHRWPRLAHLAGIAYAAGADPADAAARARARTCFDRAAAAGPDRAHPIWAAAQSGLARLRTGDAGTPWRALLDPPDDDEVAAALRRLGADALVRIVAGAAVSTYADGSTVVLDVPGIDDATAVADTDPGKPAGTSAALCAWAHDAVMAPVAAALPRSFARTPVLVLAPAGPFGAVPWHAAWTSVERRRRHVLQDAVVSYTPTARVLCEVAARRPTNPRGGPIVIGRELGDPFAFAPADGYDDASRSCADHLAAGSYAVVSTLWPVDPDITELVLHMTHHYLNRLDVPPAQALRTAQLWLRDPKRGIPGAMPAELAARAREFRSDDPADWAGFIHCGW